MLHVYTPFSASSCITWDTNFFRLSVIVSEGKEACPVMLLKKTFAEFAAVGLQPG